tara:strand:+ start:27729 stop:28055 length:327 start_codon:yes stop_codon:yes gene_type:complete
MDETIKDRINSSTYATQKVSAFITLPGDTTWGEFTTFLEKYKLEFRIIDREAHQSVNGTYLMKFEIHGNYHNMRNALMEHHLNHSDWNKTNVGEVVNASLGYGFEKAT